MDFRALYMQAQDMRESLVRVDQELAAAQRVRRSGSRLGPSDQVESIKRRRAAIAEDLADLEREMQQLAERDASPARVASRKLGRDLVADARKRAPKRAAIAKRIDAAKADLLAALQDLRAECESTQGLVFQASRCAIPDGDEDDRRRRLTVSEFAIDATRVDYSSLGYAGAVMLAEILNVFPSPHHLGSVATGWTYNLDVDKSSFLDAVTKQAEALDHHLSRIDKALADPAPIEA